MEKVEVVLQTPIDGCTMLQIVKKLKLLKKREPPDLAENFLQERSKAKWVKLGDNSRSFFSVIEHRKLQQAITQLKDAQ
ncbi:hypothetical protein H5410_040866, partial [Solanum commersonii]